MDSSSRRAESRHAAPFSKSVIRAPPRVERSRIDAPLFASAHEPSESIVEALEDNPRVTVSDVAALAGVGLVRASEEVTALAHRAGANLRVSEDGDLAYEFPANLSRVLASKSRRYAIRNAWRTKIWPRIFRMIRVGFGLSNIASLLLVSYLCADILMALGSAASNDSSSNIEGPSNLFSLHYGHADAPSSSCRSTDLGLVSSIFSYVFGDGNINANLEKQRLLLAACVIRDSNGAVTAEQLAPFLDADVPKVPESAYVDESFVLPIVAQLGGEPKVTSDGDIIYIFPQLQITSSI